MGLSFAIPIDVAMKVEDQLLAHGKVVRGRLGVTIQDVNQELAQSFGLAKPAGALVSSVEEGSPAARAGIEPGDVIVSLNGQEIAASSDLPPRVADLAPGTKAAVEIWRSHRLRKLEVGVESTRSDVAAGPGEDREHGRLGLAVRPLTREEQRQDQVQGGVLVQGTDGPAARAGIQPGDVVLSLNGTPVSGVEQLRKLVARTGKHVALLVQRGQTRIFVPLTIG
jgi:serine protease Do